MLVSSSKGLDASFLVDTIAKERGDVERRFSDGPRVVVIFITVYGRGVVLVRWISQISDRGAGGGGRGGSHVR